jgi:HK97 family phage major capsid protein
MPSERVRVRELRQERAQLIAQARAILDGADEEGRSLTEEETQQYDTLWSDVNQRMVDIERRERQIAAEQDLANVVQTRVGAEDGTGGPGGEQRTIELVSRGLREINEREPEWLQNREWQHLMATTYEIYGRTFRSWMRDPEAQRPQVTPEIRALQADADIYGGYLIPPLQMVDGLIKAVDNLVYVRQWATVHSVPNAESLGVVSLDNDPADPAWTSELAIGTEDSTMSLGKRELTPHPLGKYIKLSRTLLRKVPSVEVLVNQRLAYKFAVTMENAYLNGDGSGQPLGVFTASNNGITTSRDVSTGNTATEIRFDGLKEVKWTLKAQYWPRARWVFHRDALKQADKLKDDNGQYIWQPSVQVGIPDRLLGFPFTASEYAPNTFTASQYVGILGDFSFYWIADSLLMEMQRLLELYAATNQVGLIMRMESDGMPVLEEAFVRVQLGS